MSVEALPKVGIIFKSYEKLSSITAYARHTGELGLEGGFWITEAYPWFRQFGYETRGAMVTLAVAAMATSRVPIGLGVASPYLRHPTIQAAEAAALDELSGGRFIMGMGAGKIGTNHLEPDLGQKSTLKIHREAITIFREAIAGEKFQYVGEIFAADMPRIAPERRFHRECIPIYIGATGPNMQVLAGEIGDGLLLPNLASPSLVRIAIENAALGLAQAKRRPDTFPLGAAILCSIGTDGAKARDAVRPIAAAYIVDKIRTAQNDPMLAAAGLVKDALNILRNRVLSGHRDITALVTDAMLRQLGIVAGTPEEALEVLQELVDAGLTLPLMEMTGADEAAVLEGMTLLARNVVPRLRPGPDLLAAARTS